MTSSLGDRELRRLVGAYQDSSAGRSMFQAATTLGAFFVVWAAMYALTDISSWLALAMAPLAAGLLVRIFIIQHDCGHGAFFRSRSLNDGLGFLCSLLTLTPYAAWRRQHAGHHGVWNNLDARQRGADIYSSCLTLDEYLALPRRQRLWFRLSRSPLVANVLVPPFVFALLYRFPFDLPRHWRRERIAVYATNLALVIVFAAAGWLLGFERVAIVHLPIIALGSIVGVWLFTVQHRSEGTVWARRDDWSGVSASLHGSNHLRLPCVLQWFTGNIGLHHVHHLNPRIPNYRLQRCHESVEALHGVPSMSLRGAFRAMRYVLWDEARQRMITLHDAERLRDRALEPGALHG